MHYKIETGIPAPSITGEEATGRTKSNRSWPWAHMRKGDSISMSRADWVLGRVSMYNYTSRTGKKFEWRISEYTVRVWCIEVPMSAAVGRRIQWPFTTMDIGASVRYELALWNKGRMASVNASRRTGRKFEWERGTNTCTCTRIA